MEGTVEGSVEAVVGIYKGDSLHEGCSLYIGDSLYESEEELGFPSLWRSLWRDRLVWVFWCGRLVVVVGVGSKCFLIPGLLVWTLVWVGGVGCWRGISKLRRCDHHPCEVLQFNQCSV